LLDLVQVIAVAGGLPVTEHTICWLFPWITLAVAGEITTFSKPVNQSYKTIIFIL
jgi:hypothetical protein